MEKRIFIAVLISIGFLWLWAYAAPKLFPELAKKPAPVEQKAKTTTTAATPAPSTTTNVVQAPQPAPSPAVQPATAPVTAPVAASRIVQTDVQGDGYVARFSNR